uniref:Uncharacterized protein n=1 Tax=Cacopsylla melanoneura TaxID=428564 RepID=A0A8D9E258_9HEMI
MNQDASRFSAELYIMNSSLGINPNFFPLFLSVVSLISMKIGVVSLKYVIYIKYKEYLDLVFPNIETFISNISSIIVMFGHFLKISFHFASPSPRQSSTPYETTSPRWLSRTII